MDVARKPNTGNSRIYFIPGEFHGNTAENAWVCTNNIHKHDIHRIPFKTDIFGNVLVAMILFYESER